MIDLQIAAEFHPDSRKILQDSFEKHFPILIMQRDHEDVKMLNRELAELLLTVERDGSNWSPNSANQYNAGFSTNIDFLQRSEPCISRLRDMVEAAFRTYLAALADGGLLALDAKMIDLVDIDAIGWGVILRNGQWICPHTHPGGGFAATYAVRIPRLKYPEGCLEFVNPLGLYGSDPAFAAHPTRRHMPKEGRLMIFPSHYVHLVYPVPGDEPRISFNFTINAG